MFNNHFYSQIILSIVSISFSIISILLIIFYYGGRFNYYLNKKFNEKILDMNSQVVREGKNIIIEIIPEFNYDKYIILGAHYDSININYNYILYALIFILTSLGTLILGIIYILLNILFLFSIFGLNIFGIMPFNDIGSLFNLILIFFSSIVSIALILWINVKMSNKSTGSSDNASGIAILIELLHVIKDLKFNFRLDIIFFGDEEEGLIGSINFVKNRLNELKKFDVEMISLDTLGTKGILTYASSHGIPKLKYSDDLIKKILKAADELKIKTKPQWFPYPASDHAPFIFAKVKATQLYNKSLIANTKQDTINRIKIESLEQTGNLILKYLENLNKETTK